MFTDVSLIIFPMSPFTFLVMQGESQELKQINPLHSSHLHALSQACAPGVILMYEHCCVQFICSFPVSTVPASLLYTLSNARI